MDERPNLSFRNVEIPQDRIKWDLEQHDRYQQFSSELLKLALGGLALIGFLLVLILKDPEAGLFDETLRDRRFWNCLKFAGGFFALTCLTALGHKYLASDGMHHHMRAIKFLIWHENNTNFWPWDEPRWRSEIHEDERLRNRQFKKSWRFLRLASLTFIAGVIMIVAAILQLEPHKSKGHSHKDCNLGIKESVEKKYKDSRNR